MTKINGFPDAFPSAFDNSVELPVPRTLNELAMIKLSASIRTKPEWWVKYKDAQIRAIWKAEALRQTFTWIERATMLVPKEEREQYIAKDSDDVVDVSLTEKQAEYVLDELDGYAKLLDETTGIQVSCFDGVWQTDTLIPPSLRSSLIEEIRVLEDVPEYKKDWHPNSDNQVLDLVHPSLYPVIYGRTLGRYPNTNGPVIPIESPFPAEESRYVTDYRSNKYQWLPTEFQVDENGDVVALGYINNLHPSHEGLYKCVENLIKHFIPLWERVLTDMLHELPTRIQGSYLPIEEIVPNYPRYEEKSCDTSEVEEEVARVKEEGGQNGKERVTTEGTDVVKEGAQDEVVDGAEQSDEVTSMDYSDRLEEYMETVWSENKIVGLPDVPEGGYPGGLEKRQSKVSLQGKKLQIIVKLANIHLTPDKPEYRGGSWHLEGMANEHIVASGIYYYDQENITTNELAFRIAVDEPEPSQSIQAGTYDYYAHERTWGMVMDYSNSTKLNNVVGAVETREGRCIAFPNSYQHRVSPFQLVDPRKPGHRKIVALFLVDPSTQPIPSTTHVPPQQASWAIHALGTTDMRAPVHRLPIELIGMIEDESVLMDEREAKEVRLDLMKERTTVIEKVVEDSDYFLFSRVFNLCEH